MLLSKKAWQFLGISMGLASVIGLILYATNLGVDSLVSRLIIAFTYMFTPLVAALIVEGTFRKDFVTLPRTKRAFVKLLLPATVGFLVFIALLFATTFILGNVLHVAGVGELLSSMTQLKQQLITAFGVSPEQVASANLPPSVAILVIASVFAAVIAGATVNAPFTFGEEYGWRGFFWDEVAHFGWVKANVITGIVWGLWHAPLILQGYNYQSAVLGIGAMIVFTTCASFSLSAVRKIGNVLSACALHGMVNAIGVSSVVLFIGIDPIIGGLVGLVGAICLLVVGVALWLFVARRPKLA